MRKQRHNAWGRVVERMWKASAAAARRKRLTRLGVLVASVVAAGVVILIATSCGSTNRRKATQRVQRSRRSRDLARRHSPDR